MSEEAYAQHKAEALEDDIRRAFKDRQKGPPFLPKGWTQHLGLTRRARSMLLDHQGVRSFDGRNATYGPKWKTWGVYSSPFESIVYPLLGFLRKDFRGSHGILEEMCLWHILNYYAHFTISHDRRKNQYRICRSHQRPPPWSPQDRASLIRLFQILGVLNFNSLEEFARIHGNHGCADRIRMDPALKVIPYSPPGAYSSGYWPRGALKGGLSFSPSIPGHRVTRGRMK